MRPQLAIAALTHPGKVRSHNEDFVRGDAAAGFAVLADGMGGHNAGEVASRMAVELVSDKLAKQQAGPAPDAGNAEAALAEHLALANMALLHAARSTAAYDGMGTTLVAVLWQADRITFGHVGDSRLYVLRGSELRQLTRDHSIVQEQVECGAISAEDARYAPNRNVLTRAVGIDAHAKADVHTAHVNVGDIYLLCSDGLTDMLSDNEVRDTLLSCGGDVDVAAGCLIERANQSGGLDNISVIVVRIVAAAVERVA